MSQEEGDVPAQHGTSPSSYIPRTALRKRDSRQAAKLQQAVGKPFQTGNIAPSGWEPNLIKQATKLFLAGDKTCLGWEQNYFQALKIYFQALVIYFQALIIYFQGLKIIFRHVLRNFVAVHKGFLLKVRYNRSRMAWTCSSRSNVPSIQWMVKPRRSMPRNQVICRLANWWMLISSWLTISS